MSYELFQQLPRSVRERVLDQMDFQYDGYEDSSEQMRARILGGYPHLSDEDQVARRMECESPADLRRYAEEARESLLQELAGLDEYLQNL